VTNYHEYNQSLKKRGKMSLYFPDGDLLSQFIDASPYTRGVSGRTSSYRAPYVELMYTFYRLARRLASGEDLTVIIDIDSFRNSANEKMTHVVTENCIKCKYTDCVDVCPVDCFREGPNFLVIDPSECIDCAICVAECPANAIFSMEEVPETQRRFIQLNAELAAEFSLIDRSKASLDDADEWNGAKGKLKMLEMRR